MATIGIIGGGVIGASCASHLSEYGHEVRLVERDEIGAGTTASSMAVFFWQDIPPEEVGHQFRQRSWEEYDTAIGDGTLEYTQTGACHVAYSKDTLEKYFEYAEKLREFGLDAQVRFDILPENDEVVGTLYTPEDGHFDPVAIARQYARLAEQSGADNLTDTTVTDIHVSHGHVDAISTDDERIPIDAVVNAAGPWAPAVDEYIGLEHPLRRTSGPIVRFNTSTPAETPFLIFEDELYLRQHPDGVYVGHYNTTYMSEQDVCPKTGATPSTRFLERASNLVERVTDADSWSVEDEWIGYRTVTPDGFPLVGETAVDGYYLATGMSGLGITRAPAVGQLLTDAIADEKNSLLPHVSPARFS